MGRWLLDRFIRVMYLYKETVKYELYWWNVLVSLSASKSCQKHAERRMNREWVCSYTTMSDEMQILDHISRIPRVPHPSDSGFLSLSKISIHREGAG